MNNSDTSSPAHPSIRIAVFASGTGTNARKIIDHFRQHPVISVALIVCNKAGAGVVSIAKEKEIPILMLEKRHFMETGNVAELQHHKIDFIALAGFLWMIPKPLVETYRNKIINIHPALLPLFGGKGMYGNHVHQAVLASTEKESGITIHFVDEHYDNGDIIFQAKCPVNQGDSPSALAERIHKLEYEYYPRIIEEVISRQSVKMTQQ